MLSEELIEKIFARMGTKEELQAAYRLRERAYEVERVKRMTCSECGVDTGKYSHTFRCYWRGSGF